MIYQDIKYEIERIADLNREVDLHAARKCYNQYVKSIIKDSRLLTKIEKENLFDIWDVLKGD